MVKVVDQVEDMNDMSKKGRHSTMHAYLILLHTLFMVTNVYHAYCYMLN